MVFPGILEFRNGFFAGQASSLDETSRILARIDTVEGAIRAIIALDRERTLADAGEMDARRGDMDPDSHPLAGVPMVVKDNMCTAGLRTTCGSRILGDYIPPYDATVVRRLREAGAVILGKANMDEFAMGSSTENSAFEPTRNPWDPQRVPGGSSGGSAAAVAAGECLGALGSDTGGSIRQPASFCGVVGFKPTYGRVSRYGLVAFASSLDQIGPLTRNVADTALLMNVIAGHDPCDSTSADLPVPDYLGFMGRGVEGMTLGIPREYFREGVSPEVESAVRGAVDLLSSMGARVKEISLPHTDYAVAVYYLLATAEASSNLARYDGVRYGFRDESAPGLMSMYRRTRQKGFGGEVQRRIMLGTYALSAGYYEAYYGKAQKVRTLIRKDFDEAFAGVDLVVTPTAPTTAFLMGEKMDDPLQMYLSDICTIPVNLAGLPGISLPCGFDSRGLPVGLQIIGRTFEEGPLLQAAEAYESAAGLVFPESSLAEGGR